MRLEYITCVESCFLLCGQFSFKLVKKGPRDPALLGYPGATRARGNVFHKAGKPPIRSTVNDVIYLALMDEEPEVTTRPRSDTELDPGYLVICWDDPVNLMDYVTHVFQKVFGWPKAKAERHMLEVHQTGKSLLARETLEKAEHYVHQLQAFNLQATMERDQ